MGMVGGGAVVAVQTGMEWGTILGREEVQRLAQPDPSQSSIIDSDIYCLTAISELIPRPHSQLTPLLRRPRRLMGE